MARRPPAAPSVAAPGSTAKPATPGERKPPALTSAQIRAARALIRWTAEDLARETAVSVTTIRRAELTESVTALTAVNDRVIRQALERAGVTFVDQNGGGPGVRLRGNEKVTGKWEMDLPRDA